MGCAFRLGFRRSSRSSSTKAAKVAVLVSRRALKKVRGRLFVRGRAYTIAVSRYIREKGWEERERGGRE